MKKEGPGLPSTERATSSPMRALSSSGRATMEGQAVLGDSNVAAGKFFFGVNRGPTPLASDFGSTSPPISGLAGHGNNGLESRATRQQSTFWDDFLAAVVAIFFLKHCS